MAKQFNPLGAEALEMGVYQRYGILIGLLDVLSVRYQSDTGYKYNPGVYAEISEKHPNTMRADPEDFAQKCFYSLADRIDVASAEAREMQDQAIALLASIAEMPKGEPEGIWLHYYYRTRNMLHPYTVGDRIKTAREAAGMTQEGLAEALGVTAGRQQISNWENGFRAPRRETLGNIAKALGAKAGWLMYGE